MVTEDKITCHMKSPVGWLRLTANEKGLEAIDFLTAEPKSKSPADTPILEMAANQLSEYFEGDRTRFDVPLDLEGTTFQKKVWRQLKQIPFGKTSSYSEIANKVGCLHGARAIGMAGNKNPIPIIIPCHRVIGKSGDLTGYAAGISFKKNLLQHEGVWF